MPITRGIADWDAEDHEEVPPGPTSSRRRRKLIPIALTSGAFGLVALSASLLFVDMADSEVRAPDGARLSEAIEPAPLLSARRETVRVARVESPAAPSMPTQSQPAALTSPALPAGNSEPSEQRWARDVPSAPLHLQDIQVQAAPAPAADETAAASPEVAPALPAEAAAERTVRIARAVNLRAEPETGAKRVARLAAGTPVAVLGCEEGWCRVETDSRHGFVASALLQEQGAKPRRKAARKDPAKQAPQPDDQELEGLPGVFPYVIASARSEG